MPYPMPPYPPPIYDPDWPGYGGASSARLEVSPVETEVYVDGRYAGKVSQFHGFWQRLDLPAGRHELTLYLEGYRTMREKVQFEPDASYKIKWTMERLAAGEASGPRPEPPRRVARAAASQGAPSSPRGVPSSPTAPSRPRERSGFGTLTIRVQPADATVLIDGERWEAPESGSRLAVHLSEGTHSVEVGKKGFETYSSRVRVHEDQVTRLNVSLPTLESQ
jgi:PEGA domain-containing protein